MSNPDDIAYWRVQASHWEESAKLAHAGERAALARVAELEAANRSLVASLNATAASEQEWIVKAKRYEAALAQPAPEPVGYREAYQRGFAAGKAGVVSSVMREAPDPMAWPERALLAFALGALEYHVEQTRPIERSSTAIRALKAALAAAQKSEDEK